MREFPKFLQFLQASDNSREKLYNWNSDLFYHMICIFQSIIQLIYMIRYVFDKQVAKKRKKKSDDENAVQEEKTYAWKCELAHRGCAARLWIQGDLCVKESERDHTCGLEPNSYRAEIADVRVSHISEALNFESL